MNRLTRLTRQACRQGRHQARRLARLLALPLALAGAAVLPAQAQAQAQAPADASAVTWHGSLRGAAWSGNRHLDDRGALAVGALWLRADARLGEHASLVADTRLQAGGTGGGGQARLRELALRLRWGPADLRLGRQVIAWGRADAINPTDSVGGRDYTLLTEADTDQRSGADAVSLRYALGEQLSLQAVWVPGWRSDTLPLRRQAGQQVRTVAPRQRDSAGLKLDHTGGAVDWSVSAYDGLDRMPDLALVGAGPTGLQLALANHPVRVLGADFSTTLGQTVLRGEVGWSRRATLSPAEALFRKRSQWLAVVGGDHSFDHGLNLNLQVFVQRVHGWRDPATVADPVARAVATVQAALNNQGRRAQTGLSLRIARSWDNDRWQAELAGVHSLTTHGHYLRGLLRRQIDDHWQWQLGFEHYRGADDTVFGQLRANRTAHAEIRYQF